MKIIKLIIYYNKFKTSDLVIRNNSSPSIGVLQKNIIYQFKCPLGGCISENKYIYIGLTSTTLSRRFTMHPSDTSSIAQHLKKHSCPTEVWKVLTENTTILEHQNNKQKQILEALHIRNTQPKLNRINFQTSAKVLKCL